SVSIRPRPRGRGKLAAPPRARPPQTVSIRPRPRGRGKPGGAGEGERGTGFQSAPGPEAGGNEGQRAVGAVVVKFQSAPGPEAGGNRGPCKSFDDRHLDGLDRERFKMPLGSGCRLVGVITKPFPHKGLPPSANPAGISPVLRIRDGLLTQQVPLR